MLNITLGQQSMRKVFLLLLVKSWLSVTFHNVSSFKLILYYSATMWMIYRTIYILVWDWTFLLRVDFLVLY